MISKYFLMIFFFFMIHSAFSQLQQINIGNAEINYFSAGSGVPVVFVHGGLEDYRVWEPQVEKFSRDFRILGYSRRYNYPNTNTAMIENFSSETEADDLAAMMTQLKLESIHLVGHSFGGLTALTFAKKYPHLVRSLTLSEPPVYNWLPSLPGGQDLHDKFYNSLWRPVKIAFDLRDTADVLRHTLAYFFGDNITDQLPPEIKSMLIANFAEWKALANSSNAFTVISAEDVQNLKMPILLLTAGNTFPELTLTNSELVRLLPNASHFHFSEGTHDYWFTHPEIMGDEVLKFIRQH